MTVLLALLLAAAPARAQDAAGERWDARLTAVTGEVVVHPADGSEDVAAAADMPLEEGDRVTTGAGASADVALDDGGLISLREGSDFTLTDTRKAESSFTLALGSLLAKIQTLGARRLSVRTPTAVAAVRGTEFGVDVDGEESHVGVFDEGRVEVEGSGGTEVLTPNQETSVRRGSRPLRAFALKRFAARRSMMRAQLRRLAGVRKRWKRLPPEQRREKRREAFERMRALKRGLREQRREQKREQKQERREQRSQRRRPSRGGRR